MSKIQSFINSIKRPLLLLPLLALMVACSQEPLFEEQSSRSKASVEGIQVSDYQVAADGEGAQLLVQADLAVQLDPELISAAVRGVPLYFVYEVKITETKWYFFEKEVTHQSQQWLITYQSLLRQWSVNDGVRASQEISLEDSLRHISNSNTMKLALAQPLDTDKKYTAKLRLHLDTTQLPGAFQFNLFNFRSVWSLTSEWQKLIFQTSTLKSNA